MKVNKSGKQLLIKELLDKSNLKESELNKFYSKIANAFIQADIPFNKLNNESFRDFK
jgi:hypothetical protein